MPTEAFEDAFLRTITSDIEHELKSRVMAVIQPQIDAAINSAVDALRVRVHANKDFLMDKMVIHLVVNK